MLYYLPLFLILCLSSLVEVWGAGRAVLCGKDNRRQEWLLIAVTMFAVLFIGLRYYTGSDWSLYIAHFTQSASVGNSTGFEKGYYFFNKFIFLNTDNYYILQMLASCFILISAMCFFKNNSKYPVLIFSIFIFAFFSTALMAQIRQTIALGFILISARYIFERRFLLFLLMVMIACQFHISAIIALPLYFFNKNYGKILPIILILISQISYLYPHFFISFLETVTPYLPGRLSVISANYLTKAAVFIKPVKMQTGSYYIARVLLTIFLVVVTKPKNSKDSFFINALTVATCIKGLSLGMGILQRLAEYYLIFGIVAYTFLLSLDIPKRLQFSLLRRIKLLGITFFIIAFFAIAFWRSITADKISDVTKRPHFYPYIPYYNVLYHSEDANKRKDWNE